MLWKLLVSKGYVDKSLCELAKETVISGFNISHICGAYLYLGKNGYHETVLGNFKEIDNYMIQRHALIALQEVPHKTVKEEVHEHVFDNCKGLYHYLKNLDAPNYVEPPEEVPYTELISGVSYYV